MEDVLGVLIADHRHAVLYGAVGGRNYSGCLAKTSEIHLQSG